MLVQDGTTNAGSNLMLVPDGATDNGSRWIHCRWFLTEPLTGDLNGSIIVCTTFDKFCKDITKILKLVVHPFQGRTTLDGLDLIQVAQNKIF